MGLDGWVLFMAVVSVFVNLIGLINGKESRELIVGFYRQIYTCYWDILFHERVPVDETCAG